MEDNEDIWLESEELKSKEWKIVRNPVFRGNDSEEKKRLKYFIFDDRLFKLFTAARIIKLDDLIVEGKLLEFEEIKNTIKKRSKKKMTIEQYQELKNTLVFNNEIKREVKEILLESIEKIELSQITWNEGAMLIATDGSGSETATGYSVYFGPGCVLNIKRNLPFASNNTAELTAINEALKRVPSVVSVRIISDSEVSINRIRNYEGECGINRDL